MYNEENLLNTREEPALNVPLDERTLKQISAAQFFMLRYETEYTPCTGITAVTKQERRCFKHGVMIAPWCPRLDCNKAEHDPLATGKVIDSGWEFKVKGRKCKVLTATDDHAPILFLAVEGRFEGVSTPYDLPLPTLREDTLYFGLAVDALLKTIGSDHQFVWGADWESVPALHLVKKRHHTALTLHNTFDECLMNESPVFGRVYQAFHTQRKNAGGMKTALEIGLEEADVVTTVNRGFAWGLTHEPLQTKVMASHLQANLDRVVGVNNAAFTRVKPALRDLKDLLLADPVKGARELFRQQSEARKSLPEVIRQKATGKVLVVSMGRRVAQKQHDLVVESARQLLSQDPDLPLFIYFATTHGDEGSPARLERIRQLEEEFPGNVAWVNERLRYFEILMKAADYNCMSSLYEPHGGVYEGTVVPIARAVDGLAEQVCGLEPQGEAAKMNALWHNQNESPAGFLFREPAHTEEERLIHDLRELLSMSPSPENDLFLAMRDALSETLLKAIRLRLKHPAKYAKLVCAAIEKQESTSWEEHLKRMMMLVEEARRRRKTG